MKMKRLLVIVLALIMVATAFSACGGEEGGAEVDKSKGIRAFEGVTINMIAEQQTPTVALSEQLGAFEELTGIKVKKWLPLTMWSRRSHWPCRVKATSMT